MSAARIASTETSFGGILLLIGILYNRMWIVVVDCVEALWRK